MLALSRIVGFGASSTEGVYDPAAGGFIQRLAAWAKTHSPQTAVLNRGIGGNYARDMLARIPTDVAAHRPDLIVFLPGINDVPRGDGLPRTPLPNYRATTHDIFSQLTALAPTIFITPFRPDCAKLAMNPALLGSYISAAREECTARRIPILDLPTLVSPSDDLRFWHTDGLHFNPAGHEFIFTILRDYLLAHHRNP